MGHKKKAFTLALMLCFAAVFTLPNLEKAPLTEVPSEPEELLDKHRQHSIPASFTAIVHPSKRQASGESRQDKLLCSRYKRSRKRLSEEKEAALAVLFTRLQQHCKERGIVVGAHEAELYSFK
jgi:hypothetical protein